jgi:predicted glycoside hydrolase/deacetylase ChbG (UPF0249 family)
MSAVNSAGDDTARRHIWLCADDYGLSKGVDEAIRKLIAQGRLNATSVMMVAPSLDGPEAASLDTLNTPERRAAIGLHLTLTAPFRPLSKKFRPLRNDAFLPLGSMLLAALRHGLHRARLVDEVTAQIEAFRAAFGRPPDFIDGHQHVHVFPQVRDALIDVAGRLAPDAWLRQCGRNVPMHKRWTDPKALLLDALSLTFSRRARTRGLSTNPAFAGTYAYRDGADFPRLFPSFLEGLPAGSVVMCHPGFVDDELKRLDPLTSLREREYAYLAGDAFPHILAAHGLTLS